MFPLRLRSLALSGCGSLIGPSDPPLQIYRLAPEFPAAAGGAPVTWQLSVGRPTTAQTLDSERVALVRGATMDYYADAQSDDTVPRLVQSLLVEAFERSGRIAAVAPESEGLRTDFMLVTELRDFEAQYGDANGAPIVTVDIAAKLLEFTWQGRLCTRGASDHAGYAKQRGRCSRRLRPGYCRRADRACRLDAPGCANLNRRGALKSL